MIFSNLKYSNRYGFEKAFEFLKNASDLEKGKYPIDGDDIYAIVQENQPKTALIYLNAYGLCAT